MSCATPLRATLDYGEREDREVERLVRPPPKSKPPRFDLRRNRTEAEPDPDLDEPDPDLSMNYKVVGARQAARRVQRDQKDKRPGDYWQADTAWGVWPPDADHPTSAPDEDSAKQIALGGDDKDEGEEKEPEKKPEKDDRPQKLRAEFKRALKVSLDEHDSPAMRDMLALEGDDFVEAMGAYQDRLSSTAKAIGRGDFGWVRAAIADAAKKPKDPDSVGAGAAAAALVDRIISNPGRLGGYPLEAGAKGKRLEAAARGAFRIYRSATPEVRQKALDSVAKLAETIPEDDPRRPHLEARIDGLALACYLEGEDPVGHVVDDSKKKKPKAPDKEQKPDKGKGPPSRWLSDEDTEELFPFLEPGSGKKKPDEDYDEFSGILGGWGKKEVRLRPEMAPSFGKLVRVMSRAGEAESLLLPPDEFFGPRGRSAVSKAIEQADDDQLHDMVKDGPFEEIGELVGEGSNLNAGQKAVLRDALRRVVLEDSTTMQAVLNAAESSDNEARKRSSTRSMRKDLQKRAKRDAEARAATKDLVYYLRANPPDEDVVEAATSRLIMAGIKSLDEYLRGLEDAGEIEPIPPDNPNLAKVRHALKTGDLKVLWAKVVDPESIAPLSKPQAQEDSSMSDAKKPAPSSKSASKMPPVVASGRRILAAQIDQCVLALEQNQQSLGISPKAIQAFSHIADQVSDYLDGGDVAASAPPAGAPAAAQAAAPAAAAQAAAPAAAQAAAPARPAAAPARPAAAQPAAAPRQAAQRQAMENWNPDEIGREVAGPLEDETPNDTTFNGEFTQKNFRELGDLWEAGKLDPDKVNPEPRPARPGLQASSVDFLRQLEAQARTLRKGLQAGIVTLDPARETGIAKAAFLAGRALRNQVRGGK